MILFTFEDRDGEPCETGYHTTSLVEAERYGQKHGYNVMENEYVWRGKIPVPEWQFAEEEDDE